MASNLEPPTALQSSQTELCEACRNGHLDQVKKLITNWKRHATPGEFGTALHESSALGHFQIAEFLLKEGAEVDTLDRDGRTPLQCAVSVGKDYVASLLVCHGADLNNVPAASLLTLQCEYDPHWSRATPLMLASARGDCSFVRDRISSGSDVNKKNTRQQSALDFACYYSSAEAVELLLNAGAHVNVEDHHQNTPYMLASMGGNNEEVKLANYRRRLAVQISENLATEGNMNIIMEDLPYAYARGYAKYAVSRFQLFIVGKLLPVVLEATAFQDAVTQDISFQTMKAICVAGNALSGKSTLVASLKNEEAIILQKAWNYLFGIGGISQRTTGIEPIPFNSKRFGSVMFFDFAGQQEYHGPHELFLKSILSRGLSTVTVIVVVKATEEGPAIAHQLNRWLYPLSQASILSSSNQVRIIVVASHMDKVKKTTDAKRKLESAYEDIKQAFVGAPLQFVDLVYLDCRQPYSEGIDKLCQYLNDVPFPKYKTEDAGYSIPWIISRIHSTIHDKVIAVADLSVWIDRYRNDLPGRNFPDADTVCRDLSSTGHVLYLPNSQDLAKGWLVLDPPYILQEVYGTIFSPFSQRRIADQFGLVPVTTLADLFPSWNSSLICGILIALEFAIKVDSTMCRELKSLSSGSEGGNGEEMYPQHLFFPALVSSQRSDVFKESSAFVLRWLFRVNSQSYITPLILQSTIHNLTTKHILFHEQGSLRNKYLCRVWYNGIFWQTSSVDIAVQVSDSSVVQVIATSDTSAEELFKYTTTVVGDISSTIHTLAPGMSGSSYIICPGEPQALLENPQAPSPLHMFPVDFILDSLKKNQTACLSLMDGDCPATRMEIPSLFCGFEPTIEEISGLLLQPIVTPIAGRETTEQRLDKCRDKLISDPSSQSVLQSSKVDAIIPSPVCFEVEALQTLPLEKDLRRIADNCGDNGEKLLTFLGLKLTEIQGFRRDANTSSDAFFQGLVCWLGGNADDFDPVNWSTLLTAMKEASMAGDARKWKEKIVERCAASLDKPRDAGQSGNDETLTPGQEEPSISSNVSKSTTTEV